MQEEIEKMIAAKPNFLIEACQGFKDIFEFRIFLLMLYRAYDNEDISKAVEIDVNFIIPGDTGGEYRLLREACDGIVGRTINLLPRHKKSFSFRNLVSMAEHIEGSGKLRVKFNSDIVLYILNLVKSGNYTKIFLKHALPLRSLYSARIYELLLERKKFHERTIKYDELRFFLDVPDNVYKLWGHFRQSVIVPAQKHLKKYTDITFTFDLIKRSKKVDSIHFIIENNVPSFSINTEQTNLFENPVSVPSPGTPASIPEYEKIVKDFIWPRSQESVLKTHSPEKIVYYYRQCRAMEAEKKIIDFPSFFFRALNADNDRFDEKQAAQIRANQERERIRTNQERTRQEQQETEEEVYNRYLPRFQTLAPAEQQWYIDRAPAVLSADMRLYAAVLLYQAELSGTMDKAEG